MLKCFGRTKGAMWERSRGRGYGPKRLEASPTSTRCQLAKPRPDPRMKRDTVCEWVPDNETLGNKRGHLWKSREEGIDRLVKNPSAKGSDGDGGR